MNFVKRFSSAPLAYISDLRRMSFKQYLHIGTNFSPSYPVMIFTALTFTLIYCALILYFVFSQPSGPCLTHIRGAVYILAFLYPFESILCFICLTGTIALSKNRCWKVTWILLFGPVLCGFGFGQVGLIQACILQKNEIITIPLVFTKPEFLDAMVYLYLSFLCLYFILIPSINFLYNRLSADLKTEQDKTQQNAIKNGDNSEPVAPTSSCCKNCITVTYYALNVMLFISFAFIFLVKIFGPFFYTYLWLQSAVNIENLSTPLQKFMLASLLLAYFAPISLMLITIGIQSIVKFCKNKQKFQFDPKDLQTQSATSSKGRDTWKPNDPKLDLTQGMERKSVLSQNERKSISLTKQYNIQKKNTLNLEKKSIESSNIQKGQTIKLKKEPLL